MNKPNVSIIGDITVADEGQFFLYEKAMLVQFTDAKQLMDVVKTGSIEVSILGGQYVEMENGNIVPAESDFTTWWNETGSMIVPAFDDDMEDHARKVAEQAWKAAKPTGCEEDKEA